MLPPTDNVTFLTQKKKNFTRGWEKFSKKGLGWGGVGGKGVFFLLPACLPAFSGRQVVLLLKKLIFLFYFTREDCAAA
jgi:hypothetical protein